MGDTARTSRNFASITVLLVLCTVTISVLTYREILTYFFTGEDTLILIDSSRIHSSADLTRVLTSPLMSGSPAAVKPEYYRPISSLSYALDYNMWKLDPFGYNLTDLLLHSCTSVLVFFLTLRLASAARDTAVVGALIFTTHPALFNVVPSPARRQDVLATLFILLSLLALLEYRGNPPRKTRYLGLSVLACLLALGAKEIAVVSPVLVFSLLLALQASSHEPWKKKLLKAFEGSMPYFLITLVFLVGRGCILAGADSSWGRFVHPQSPTENLRFLAGAFVNYFADVVYPLTFLGSLFSLNPSLSAKIASCCLLAAAVVFLFALRGKISEYCWRAEAKRFRVGKILLTTLAAGSVALLLAYPLLAASFTQLIKQAYDGHGPGVFSRAIVRPASLPVEHYLIRGRDLTVQLAALVFLFCVLGLEAIRQRARGGSGTSPRFAMPMVLLIWLALPLGVYAIALTYVHRYIYLSVVPYAILMSILLCGSFRTMFQKLRSRKSAGSVPTENSLQAASSVLRFLAG